MQGFLCCGGAKLLARDILIHHRINIGTDSLYWAEANILLTKPRNNRNKLGEDPDRDPAATNSATGRMNGMQDRTIVASIGKNKLKWALMELLIAAAMLVTPLC